MMENIGYVEVVEWSDIKGIICKMIKGLRWKENDMGGGKRNEI